ncbi:recombinase family protein [Corynebacterium diphtheriae]|nr:recombinase family protein [Corynebacterium diphtheriae]CAB0757619.1 recombinase family protein [Corynebacterium diphtheriae]
MGCLGVPKAEIARRLGVGRSTLYRYLSPWMGVNDNGSQITTPGGHLGTAENIKA